MCCSWMYIYSVLVWLYLARHLIAKMFIYLEMKTSLKTLTEKHSWNNTYIFFFNIELFIIIYIKNF